MRILIQQQETRSVVFDNFHYCGTVFYQVRYGLVIPNIDGCCLENQLGLRFHFF